VLDANDKDVQSITEESLEHLNVDTWTPAQTSQTPAPSGKSSAKQTPSKTMEGEKKRVA